jgi:putative transposase
MRYRAAEKLEIIRLVEQSPLPVRHTLAKLGIPTATFYRWYDRYSSGGPKALNDRSPRPDRVWNRIPDAVRQQIIELALDQPALSPRELAVRFTDTKSYFVSEASVYRLLKAHDLIASPAFIVIKAADAFKDKTTARRLQAPPLPREHRQPHPRRRLLRAAPDHPGRARKDQTTDHCRPPLAAPAACRLTSPNR